MAAVVGAVRDDNDSTARSALGGQPLARLRDGVVERGRSEWRQPIDLRGEVGGGAGERLQLVQRGVEREQRNLIRVAIQPAGDLRQSRPCLRQLRRDDR